MEPLRHRPFNVILSEHAWTVLTRISRYRGCTRAAVIRQAIHALEQHELKSEPCCADGRRCFVPHLHPPKAIPGTEQAPGEIDQ